MTKVFDIRKTRLRNDYMMLVDLIDKSQFIRIIDIVGTIPEYYLLEFSCKGIEALDEDNSPIYRDRHEVAIYLHPEYPLKVPQISWRTPIFHPNVHNSGGVCFSWWVAKTLDELVYTLVEIAQFKYYSIHNPMNIQAAIWASKNDTLIPVDRRPIKTGKNASVSTRMPRPRLNSDSTHSTTGNEQKLSFSTNYNKPDTVIGVFGFLRDHFSLDELKTLCFCLQVNFEELPGDGISGKAREIILYHQRRDLFDQLVAEIIKTRPNMALLSII